MSTFNSFEGKRIISEKGLNDGHPSHMGNLRVWSVKGALLARWRTEVFGLQLALLGINGVS